MTYYGPKEVAESFRTVRNNTITIAGDIPAEKYGFKAAPDTRTVAQLLTHVAMSYIFHYQVHAVEKRTTLEGFDFPSLMQKVMAEEQKNRSKEELIGMLMENRDKWAQWVEGCSEGFLAERVSMPGGMQPASKSRFEMIISVKEHEMHHRGQLMLIERMLGIVPHITREMQARMASMTANKS